MGVDSKFVGGVNAPALMAIALNAAFAKAATTDSVLAVQTAASDALNVANAAKTDATSAKNTAATVATDVSSLTVKVNAAPVFEVDSAGLKVTFNNVKYLLSATALTGGAGANAEASLLPGLLYRLNPNLTPVTADSNFDTRVTAGIHVASDGGLYDFRDEISNISIGHGNGAINWVAGQSPTGRPVFADLSTSYNQAYDGAVMPPAEADKTFKQTNPTMTMIHVWKQRAAGATNILKVFGNANLTVQGVDGASDGSLYMGQSNGSINGTEDPSKVPAFGVWHIMTTIVRDNTFYNFRNEKLSLKTIPGNGVPLGGITANEFAFMNNPQATVADLLFANGVPSLSVLNAELQRLATLHGITGVGTISSADFPTVGVAPPAPTAPRAVETWQTTANYPASNTLLARSNDVPGDGLTLAAGATNYLSYSFSNIAGDQNMFTEADIQREFFHHYNFGNPNNIFALDVSTGQYTAPFLGRARWYAAGSAKSLHKIDPVNGLQLIARPTNDGTDVSDGGIEVGMIRSTAEFRPGMCVEVIYQAASHRRAWTPLWFISSRGKSPGKNGDIYANGVNQPNSYLYYTAGGTAIELDWDDMFGQDGSNLRKGDGILFNSPLQSYGVPFAIPPYVAWNRSGGVKGYAYRTDLSTPMMTTTNFNRADSKTRLLLNWRDDGSHLIDLFENGVLIQQLYLDYSYADNIIEPDGSTKKMPLHFIAANQGPPKFESTVNQVSPAEFTGFNHTLRLHSFKAWKGNIVFNENMKN